MLTVNSRTADHMIDPLFLERWSPRAFDGQPIADAEVMALFEAARWAPSTFNSQPWRLVYAKRDTPAWSKLFNLLVPFNQSWAGTAALLVAVISKTTMQPPGQDKPSPSYSHSFDTGAAWANLALQAARMGLQAHGMTGFDIDRAPAELGLPEGYRVEAMVVVGRPGDKSVLPDYLQARESPSGRDPVASFAFEGSFKA